METGQRQIVQSADAMTDEQFKLHFEKRHGDSMGGLSHFSPNITRAVLFLYRSFHKKLHELRPEIMHEHER
jgi:hypothetical protein